MIYGQIKKDIGQILRKLCEQKDIEIIEAEACPDHIHMLISFSPKYSISYVMGYEIITPRENAGFAERPHRGHNTSRA